MATVGYDKRLYIYNVSDNYNIIRNSTISDEFTDMTFRPDSQVLLVSTLYNLYSFNIIN